MRERFELKNGAKISASGIIEIYNEDMKKISNGDNIPTLQNYQVTKFATINQMIDSNVYLLEWHTPPYIFWLHHFLDFWGFGITIILLISLSSSTIK